ncbi:MAG: Co2+/Mg2+ efflux protein ApaG [Sandaracinus sp.]|nr:Co2+/Mg2+ efflux protein ApaG [Sandaracinus sp.]MCB9616839.1 Co2+/Mg2+ efflux protein ApaG [Sandaracinus sp.]
MSEPDTRSEATTEGIRVVVQSQYLAQHSQPTAGRYVFAYRVRIENVDHPGAVQLRTRHWVITNQLGNVEEVRGPGVVGETPTLRPGEAFEYTSGAVLETPRGSMHGSYQMDVGGRELDVRIAPFALAMPHSLN